MQEQRHDRRGYTTMMVLLAGALLPGGTFAAPQRLMTLRHGETRTTSFAVDDPQAGALLWLRGRIVLPEGEQEGAYALELTLNDTRLTPKNVQVLNKKSVYDRAGTVGDDPKRAGRKTISPPAPAEMFNSEHGGWYLKADADEFPFNAQGLPGDPYTSILGGALPSELPEPNFNYQLIQCLSALRSHYYEYLFAPQAGLLAKESTLKVAVNLPERLAGRTVEISFGTIVPTAGVVLYQRPIEEFVIVQQAPSLPDVVDEKIGLNVAACAGEFEPTTVTLFALEPMENVTITIEPLTPAAAAGKPIPHSAAQCHYLAQRAAHQQSQARLPFTLELGPDGVAPDVLIRMAEKPVAIGHPVPIPYNWGAGDRRDPEKTKAVIARSKELEQTPGIPVNKGTSQRFLVDLKIPKDQAPGTYRGTVVLRSGDRTLRRIPLALTVYPFKLLPPRQKYWMYRMYYLPMDHPSSVQAINMIADAGMHGICQLRGVGVGMTVDKKTGEIALDDAQLRTAKKVLQDAGLALSYATDLVSGPFYLICQQKYGVRPGDGQWFGYRLMPELLDIPLDLSRVKPHPRDPNDEQTAKLRGQLPQIKKEVIELLKRAKAKYDEVGLEVWHFAYDEPDGTAWCHPWVKFSNEVAHEAGFKTWSTHNDPFGWPSGIDMSVAAWPAILPYVPSRIHAKVFQGKMGYRGIPVMGHFKGRLDEICIYNRPLTDEEILQQHLKSAEKGRLAYYSLDAGRGTRVVNDERNAAFDLTLDGGKYARWVDGVKGKALEFEYPNPGSGVPDAKTGRPVPTPVSLSPSREMLKGEVKVPGDGWAISFWYSGYGGLCGLPGSLGLTTNVGGFVADLRTKVPGETGESRVILPGERGLPADDQFWNHVTISVDEKQGVVKYYLHNEEQRDWYRKNVKWCYEQFRGFNPMFCRLSAGNITWHLRELENMTVFVFDLNYGIANLAWAEGGDRGFNARWYPELGLLGLREGIDDARYANTLYELLKARDGDQAAWDAVARLYPGREVLWEKVYPQPVLEGLSYDDIRARLVQEILRLTSRK